MQRLENQIGKILILKNLTIATTESCTGGLLSSKLTDVSGSSAYIHLNLVTYANEAKHKMLGVSAETLENFGAVSEECSYEMAKGLQKLSGADICVSTTGIAGPTGGSKEKPVGLVYIGVYYKGDVKAYRHVFNGDRGEVRRKATVEALDKVRRSILQDKIVG